LKMKDMFQYDDARAEKYTYELNNIYFDLSKNRINFDTFSYFVDLTKSLKFHNRIPELFNGEKVNNTEDRAALHTALRAFDNIQFEEIANERTAFLKRAEEIIADENVKHIVQLGIGGSYIGPKMVNEALHKFSNRRFTIDYIANTDDTDFDKVMSRINLDKTIFVIASKSLSTSETQYNLSKVLGKLSLFHPNEQFICLTASRERALEIGFSEANILKFCNSIGGRYSLWSSIGFTIALNIGRVNFENLLKGAEKADKHFAETEDYFQNIPFLLAYINIWYRNFFDLRAKANIPYSDALKYLPEYLQQLEMESLGKIIDKQGNKVNYATGNTIFGNIGTNSQHSFFQMLHQGIDIIPVDFIAIADSDTRLLANCFAQSRALMMGQELSEVAVDEVTGYNTHKFFPGNIPSNTIMFDELNPSTLGTFLAIQEHKVFVQSVIWNINPFDQFGVELGKTIAKDIEPSIISKDNHFDSSTNNLINRVKH
ncbi:MAG: glucose-6-phosphate isomerase, partial [Candidatus Kapaibacterium sp.]